MSNTETAWKGINDVWHLYSGVKGSPAVEELRETLRKLQGLRLPIQAIDLIGSAIRLAERVVLEESWCERCGARSDGTDKCSQCGTQVDLSMIDEHSGLCLNCQDAAEDEENDEGKVGDGG